MWRAWNRWMRARMLPDGSARQTPPPPPSLAGWLRDTGRLMLLLLLLGLLLVILTAGTTVFRSISLAWFGYRPAGAWDDAIVYLFLAVCGPLCFVAFVLCLVLVLWNYRSLEWMGTQLVLALAPVLALFFLFNVRLLGPQLNEWQHLNTWPAELSLQSFAVCAIERIEEPRRILVPRGKITLQVRNRSAVAVSGAVFTVKAGSKWHRLRLSNLAPGDSRRIEIEADLGVVAAELASTFGGWANRPADVYWDHVAPREIHERAVTAKPRAARNVPVDDCSPPPAAAR